MRSTGVIAGSILLLLVGCNSKSTPHEATPTTPAPVETITSAAAPTSVDAASPPPPSLQGIGASQDAWNQGHTSDPDPKLVPNCCYLPKVDDAENSGDDTGATAQSDGGYVYSYERRFPNHTTTAEALRVLVADDLPPDARLVRHSLDGACNSYIYASKLLEELPAKSRAPFVLVTLLPVSTSNSYSPTNVVYADLSVWPDKSMPPC